MAITDLLAEEDVSLPRLKQLFEQAFFNLEMTDDGELLIEVEGRRVFVMVEEKHTFVKFLAYYRFKDNVTLEQKLQLVNKMNDEYIFCRFSVPASRPDALLIDYFLPYENGIIPFHVVSSARLFGRIAIVAVQNEDTEDWIA